MCGCLVSSTDKHCSRGGTFGVVSRAVEKLLSLSVNKNLIAWILDFLTNRTQYVKLNETISNLCKLNTGAPQGCVLSPTLYTLYTNDYRVKHSDTSLIKFADDSAFQGQFTNGLDSNYIEEV